MIKTRFAPSPTGRLHIGGLRTALYAWAYARHHQGQFILRIEDTDTARNNQVAAQGILTSMKWAGLDWDEGPVYQSDRMNRYAEVIDTLIKKGSAYYCTDTTPHDVKSGKYRGTERDTGALAAPVGIPYVIRAKIPLGVDISYTDTVKGPVNTTSDEVEDWVMVRSNGVPTYNFAVVVDDIDMGITHVIRGDDHVSNTPKQWLLYQMLGATIPAFTHIPMILDASGKKLSKRTIDKVASNQPFPVDVDSAREQGVCPGALLNYLARLGWAKGDMEVFDTATFVSLFDGSGLQSAPARVDPVKLHWLNAQHLKNLSDDALFDWSLAQNGVKTSDRYAGSFSSIAPLLRARSDKTKSVIADVSFISDFLFDLSAHVDVGRADQDVVQAAWPFIQSELMGLSNWQGSDIEAAIKRGAEASRYTFGDVAKSLRMALSPAKSTPPLSMLFCAMGREAGLDFFQNAVNPTPHTPSAHKPQI